MRLEETLRKMREENSDEKFYPLVESMKRRADKGLLEGVKSADIEFYLKKMENEKIYQEQIEINLKQELFELNEAVEKYGYLDIDGWSVEDLEAGILYEFCNDLEMLNEWGYEDYDDMDSEEEQKKKKRNRRINAGVIGGAATVGAGVLAYKYGKNKIDTARKTAEEEMRNKLINNDTMNDAYKKAYDNYHATDNFTPKTADELTKIHNDTYTPLSREDAINRIRSQMKDQNYNPTEDYIKSVQDTDKSNHYNSIVGKYNKDAKAAEDAATAAGEAAKKAVKDGSALTGNPMNSEETINSAISTAGDTAVKDAGGSALGATWQNVHNNFLKPVGNFIATPFKHAFGAVETINPGLAALGGGLIAAGGIGAAALLIKHLKKKRQQREGLTESISSISLFSPELQYFFQESIAALSDEDIKFLLENSCEDTKEIIDIYSNDITFLNESYSNDELEIFSLEEGVLGGLAKMALGAANIAGGRKIIGGVLVGSSVKSLFKKKKEKEDLTESVTFIDNAGNLKTMLTPDYIKDQHEYHTETQIEKYEKKKKKKDYKLISEEIDIDSLKKLSEMSFEEILAEDL